MEGGRVVMTLAQPVDVWDEGNGMLRVFTRPHSPNNQPSSGPKSHGIEN